MIGCVVFHANIMSIANGFQVVQAFFNRNNSLTVAAVDMIFTGQDILEMNMEQVVFQVNNRLRWVITLCGVPAGIDGCANPFTIADFFQHLHRIPFGMIFNRQL